MRSLTTAAQARRGPANRLRGRARRTHRPRARPDLRAAGDGPRAGVPDRPGRCRHRRRHGRRGAGLVARRRDGRSAGTSHPARSRCRGESGDRRGDSAHAVGQVPVRGVARGGRLHPRRPESPETGGRGGVFVRLLEHAPAGWDERLAFPTLSTTFAEASRALGFRPLYAEDGASRALVLMRGLSAQVIGPWTRGAKVNVESTDVAFATELVKAIRRSSPALVRWGDHYWPPAPRVLGACPGMRPVVRHIVEQDLTRDEDALFRGMKDEIRRKIGRASLGKGCR